MEKISSNAQHYTLVYLQSHINYYFAVCSPEFMDNTLAVLDCLNATPVFHLQYIAGCYVTKFQRVKSDVCSLCVKQTKPFQIPDSGWPRGVVSLFLPLKNETALIPKCPFVLSCSKAELFFNSWTKQFSWASKRLVGLRALTGRWWY